MLAALALALSPVPQIAIRSREVLDPPGATATIADARVLIDHPDDGAVVAASFQSNPGAGVVRMDGAVARIAPNGRTVWRSDFLLAGPSSTAGFASPTAAAVLGDGTIVAAFSDAPQLASVLLRAHGPGGALRW
ncbi:MAG: hypothetical protein AAFP86_18885, partial [Planctomycetota bacterium]